MDKIWVKTLARLDALEDRVKFMEIILEALRKELLEPEPELKPESQKDTVDLPESEPEPEQKQV